MRSCLEEGAQADEQGRATHFAERLSNSLPHAPRTRFMIFELLEKGAYCHRLSSRERTLLQQIASRLRILPFLEERARTSNDTSASGAGTKDSSNAAQKRNRRPTADHCRLLGLPLNASVEQLKQNYRQLAKRFHPDVLQAHLSTKDLPEHTEHFFRIQQAYQYLLSKHRDLKNTRSSE